MYIYHLFYLDCTKKPVKKMENFLSDMLNKTMNQLATFINSKSYEGNAKVTNETMKTQTALIVIMIILYLLAFV